MALFVSTDLGILIYAGDFLLVSGVTKIGEVFGWLPWHWIEDHPRFIALVAALVSGPMVLFLGRWSFRRAFAVEKELQEADLEPSLDGDLPAAT